LSNDGEKNGIIPVLDVTTSSKKSTETGGLVRLYNHDGTAKQNRCGEGEKKKPLPKPKIPGTGLKRRGSPQKKQANSMTTKPASGFSGYQETLKKRKREGDRPRSTWLGTRTTVL